MANLKSMSVTQLLALRDEVAKFLSTKKDELEDLMRQLGGSGKSVKPSSDRKGTGRSKVAAKYRHPSTGETWSGRGATVRWLAEEMKAGKKKEDFLITKSNGKSAKKSKKGAKAK